MEALAAARERRRTDDLARDAVQGRAAELDARRQDTEHWQKIDDLIGSADGKRFRVFAQSLTLEALLSHANEHLNDFAPRYRLMRVPAQDLDLQIIDQDMGDEVRSVNSLSGGESFLVSLALALGLSSLAARDVLHDSHDPAAEPVTLAVIVVKVDEAADAGWRNEKTLHPGTARKWTEHFRDACNKSIDLVQRQVQQELDKLANDGPLETRPERRAAVARMLESLQIHPVSAPQFRLFHAADEDDPARVRNADESRIPSFIDGLRAIARTHRARSRERVSAAGDDLRRHASTTLELVRAQWESDARAEEQAEALRGELHVFLAPKQREIDLRQGAFREFLREGVPKEIELRVSEAAQIGRSEIGKYLRKLGTLHWATLRATVRRGGAYVNNAGFHVDLPNELALRFEEPIAVVWSKHVLASLRKRTAALGADYVTLVAEVVDWARAQKARVQPRVVEALHDNLVAQTKDLSSVGKEAVDELKRKVRNQLYERLVKRIGCRSQFATEFRIVA